MLRGRQVQDIAVQSGPNLNYGGWPDRCPEPPQGANESTSLMAVEGGGAPTPFRAALGQICAAYYFLHFLVILPLVSRFETPLPLPSSISESVLHGEASEAAPAGQGNTRGGSVATATAH